MAECLCGWEENEGSQIGGDVKSITVCPSVVFKWIKLSYLTVNVDVCLWYMCCGFEQLLATNESYLAF